MTLVLVQNLQSVFLLKKEKTIGVSREAVITRHVAKDQIFMHKIFQIFCISLCTFSIFYIAPCTLVLTLEPFIYLFIYLKSSNNIFILFIVIIKNNYKIFPLKIINK